MTVFFRMLYSYPFAPSDPVSFVAFLPQGSLLASAEAGGLPATPVVTTAGDGRVRVEVPMPSMASDTLSGVRLSFMDNSRIGSHPIDFQLEDSSNTVLQTSTYDFLDSVDGAEPNTPLEAIKAGNQGFVGIRDVPYNAGGCTSLDASCTGRSPIHTDALLSGYINQPGDIDWYRMQNVRAGSRISADLTDLPFDADLVLYGPAGLSTAPSVFPNTQDLPGRFVEDPGLDVGRAATAVAAEALSDLQLDRGYHDPYRRRSGLPGADAPVHLAAPRDGSGERGRHRTGRRQLRHRVSGYNGARGDDPYLLRAKVVGADQRGILHGAHVPERDPGGRTRSCDRRRRQHGIPHEPGPPRGDLRRDRCERRRNQARRPRRLPRTHPALGLKAAVVPVDAYPGMDGAYDGVGRQPVLGLRGQCGRVGDHGRAPDRPELGPRRQLCDPRRR